MHSISPTTGGATGQTENMRCVNRALNKISAVKGICVINMLTLTALIYIYIYIYILGMGILSKVIFDNRWVLFD